MAERWTGRFYCVTCKDWCEVRGKVTTNDKGTRLARATCSRCDAALHRVVGKG